MGEDEERGGEILGRNKGYLYSTRLILASTDSYVWRITNIVICPIFLDLEEISWESSFMCFSVDCG